jgi:hypothetical protein
LENTSYSTGVLKPKTNVQRGVFSDIYSSAEALKAGFGKHIILRWNVKIVDIA